LECGDCENACDEEECAGIPKLRLSSFYLPSLLVKDTPIALHSPKGPVLRFPLVFYSGDARSRSGRHWAAGYCWSHGYERYIRKQNNTYKLANKFGAGPQFTWNGSAFVEDTSKGLGIFGKFTLEWQQSTNIVACRRRWASLRSPRPRGCAGNAGERANPGGDMGSPYGVWHATEGYLFEPSSQDANTYRL
jgi:hypothetical protein